MTSQQKTEIPGGFFEEERHIYTDAAGTRLPSVTQVFSVLSMVNFDFINKEVLARKSRLGVAVHTAIQYLCEGVLDWDTVDDVAMPYVVAAETWMKEQGFTSLAQEGQGIAEIGGMKVGYAYDNLGTMMFKGRMRHTILDYKTTVGTSPTWKLQTAAYALAAPKLPAGERYLRCILQLKADGGFTPHYFQDREDEDAFKFALYTCIWGLNNGIYSMAA